MLSLEQTSSPRHVGVCVAVRSTAFWNELSNQPSTTCLASATRKVHNHVPKTPTKSLAQTDKHELRAHQSSLTTQILGPASGLQHGRRTKQMPRHDQRFSLEKPFQAKGPRKVPWYLTSVAILLAQDHSTSQRSSQDTYVNTLLKTAFVLT